MCCVIIIIVYCVNDYYRQAAADPRHPRVVRRATPTECRCAADAPGIGRFALKKRLVAHLIFAHFRVFSFASIMVVASLGVLGTGALGSGPLMGVANRCRARHSLKMIVSTEGVSGL